MHEQEEARLVPRTKRYVHNLALKSFGRPESHDISFSMLTELIKQQTSEANLWIHSLLDWEALRLDSAHEPQRGRLFVLQFCAVNHFGGSTDYPKYCLAVQFWLYWIDAQLRNQGFQVLSRGSAWALEPYTLTAGFQEDSQAQLEVLPAPRADKQRQKNINHALDCQHVPTPSWHALAARRTRLLWAMRRWGIQRIPNLWRRGLCIQWSGAKLPTSITNLHNSYRPRAVPKLADRQDAAAHRRIQEQLGNFPGSKLKRF